MKKRRILLLFASLAVCLSMLHTAAFAQNAAEQNTAEPTTASLNANDVATLSGDCTHSDIDPATGKCKDCEFQFEASIFDRHSNTTFYATFADAINSLYNGELITLWSDVVLPSGVSLKPLRDPDDITHDPEWVGFYANLNLNGKSLSGAPLTIESGVKLFVFDDDDSDRQYESRCLLVVRGTLVVNKTVSSKFGLQLTVESGGTVKLQGGYITKDIVLNGVTHDDLLDDGYCYRVYNDGVLGDVMKSTDSSLGNYDLAIVLCEHPGYSGSGVCEYCNYKPIQLTNLELHQNPVYNGEEQTPELDGAYLDNDFNPRAETFIHGINCTFTADPNMTNGAASAIYPGKYSSIVTLYGLYYDQWRVTDWDIVKANVAEPAALTANVYNLRDDSQNKYEVDLSTLLPKLDENCEYGNISYSIAQYPTASGYTFTKAEVSDSGVLTLNTDATNGNSTGQVATMKVKVTTDNYNDFYFTVNVVGNELKKAIISISDSPNRVEYGDVFTLTATTTAPAGGTWTWTVNDDNVFEIVDGAYKSTVTLRAKKATPPVGSSIYVSYNSQTYTGTYRASLVTYPKAITKPTEDTTVYTYTGDEQTYSVADSSYYTVIGTKRTAAGSQKVVISLNDKDNYEWNDGTTDDIEYTFTVNKAKAVINVDTTPIVVTYGDAVTLPTATTNFGSVTCDKTPADLVNANTYTVTYTVVGTENYDGDTKTVSVTVNHKAITKPVEDTTVYTYTGDEQTYVVADSSYYTVIGTKRTAAGSQKLVISLNDKDNYEWNDGTTDDVEYTFTVKKAQPVQKAATTARIPVGKALENAQVEYGEFAEVDGKSVLEGAFEWTNGTQRINASTTATMRFTPNDGNYATIEFDVAVTAYVPHSGNGISSTTTVKEGNIITITTVNDDGSVTVTVKNTATGTTTETTTYTDGSMTSVETRKDGTKISVKRDKNGDVDAEIEATAEVEIKIPISNAADVTKIIVTDKNGKKTEITKFTITADGVKFTTSASGSVKFVSGTEKKEFIDVHPIEHWATEDIDYVYAKGLMMGTSEDTFEPDEPLTRGMAVTILYRAEGEPAVNKSKPFADVSADDYYANAVIWAHQNEIVNGVSENEFAPNENITREQFATIIYRYACYKGVAPTGAWAIRLTYADVAEISDYAAEGVMYCKLKGIMNGKGENMFAPSDNTTRAEAAAIFHRFLEIGE